MTTTNPNIPLREELADQKRNPAARAVGDQSSPLRITHRPNREPST